jgi:hypothetical protein
MLAELCKPGNQYMTSADPHHSPTLSRFRVILLLAFASATRAKVPSLITTDVVGLG